MMCTYKFLALAFPFSLKSQMLQEVESYSSKSQKLVKGSLVNAFKVSLITNFSMPQNACFCKITCSHCGTSGKYKIVFPHIKGHNTDQMVYAQLN